MLRIFIAFIFIVRPIFCDLNTTSAADIEQKQSSWYEEKYRKFEKLRREFPLYRFLTPYKTSYLASFFSMLQSLWIINERKTLVNKAHFLLNESADNIDTVIEILEKLPGGTASATCTVWKNNAREWSLQYNKDVTNV